MEEGRKGGKGKARTRKIKIKKKRERTHSNNQFSVYYDASNLKYLLMC